jgi:hypothetical protein
MESTRKPLRFPKVQLRTHSAQELQWKLYSKEFRWKLYSKEIQWKLFSKEFQWNPPGNRCAFPKFSCGRPVPVVKSLVKNFGVLVALLLLDSDWFRTHRRRLEMHVAVLLLDNHRFRTHRRLGMLVLPRRARWR